MSEEKLQEVGTVTHYYPKIGVVVVEVTAPIKVGDRIRIRGATTDFEQTVESMEIEHEKIEEAKPGDSIGLKVEDRVREKDVVYKVVV
ncbi:MAG: translation elongation factor-like protein [Candidatus Bathyarchaeia archaeon]